MTQAVAEPPQRHAAHGAARQPAVRLDGRHQGVRLHARCSTTCRSTCRPGCGFVILGRSGTGKSVTLRHIIGLVRPDAGKRVRAGGRGQRTRRASSSRGAPVDRVPVPERRALRFDLGWRERRVPDAPAHQDGATARSASGRSRSSPRWGSSGNTTRCRRRSPAACASAPDWRAPWRSIRRCCWSTSPAPASIRSRRTRSTPCSSTSRQQSGTTLVVVTHNIPSARRLGDRARDAARRPHPGARHGRRARPPATTRWCARSCSPSIPVDMPNTRLAAVGAFVVGGVLLFAVGLFLIGSRRMLFSDTFELYAEFTQIAALDNGRQSARRRDGRRRSQGHPGAVDPVRTLPRPDAGAERSASAAAARLGRHDPERRSRREQVRPDRRRYRGLADCAGRGHDQEPGALRYRRPDVEDERHDRHGQLDHRRPEGGNRHVADDDHRHRR